MYRKTTEIPASLREENKVELALKQKRMVEHFFQSKLHNQNEDDTFKRAHFPFEQANAFET